MRRTSVIVIACLIAALTVVLVRPVVPLATHAVADETDDSECPDGMETSVGTPEVEYYVVDKQIILATPLATPTAGENFPMLTFSQICLPAGTVLGADTYTETYYLYVESGELMVTVSAITGSVFVDQKPVIREVTAPEVEDLLPGDVIMFTGATLAFEAPVTTLVRASHSSLPVPPDCPSTTHCWIPWIP